MTTEMDFHCPWRFGLGRPLILAAQPAGAPAQTDWFGLGILGLYGEPRPRRYHTKATIAPPRHMPEPIRWIMSTARMDERLGRPSIAMKLTAPNTARTKQTLSEARRSFIAPPSGIAFSNCYHDTPYAARVRSDACSPVWMANSDFVLFGRANAPR